ncbi:hypothetical protein K490DRAFT_44726 [Saccharata proteae CBS 121410]|uniref:Zn(2)-C6 fungal-type domain-containing protein n=1 Tax=Saccharata proteae CBS 121410 TaxID=1314787 RepID=A0A9P4HUP0_9PEZI|nr:hypothetical protein K490DRAFT_44726 [Saccharata proteae CBS 121410]
MSSETPHLNPVSRFRFRDVWSCEKAASILYFQSHFRLQLPKSYRRNGKLQSCEACRKGKLRCDHIMPNCGRCARRRLKCVYHPAPMTRGVSARLSEPALSPPLTDSPIESPRQETAAVAQTVPVTVSNSVETPAARSAASVNFRLLNGFLGSTSFSAVLTEHEDSLGITESTENEPLPQTTSNPRITTEHVRKGAEVLSLLKDMPIFDRYIQKFYNTCQGIVTIEPIMKHWASSLWSTYGNILQARDPEQLLLLSEKVWRNTEGRLRSDTVSTAQAWLELSSGDHLRWEVVGITLVVVGLASTMIPEWDPILSFDRTCKDRRSLIIKLFRAGDTCLKFCEELSMVNDIGAWLMYELSALYVWLHGDVDYSSWQRIGQTINALVALGWHQDVRPCVGGNLPFFLMEIRKRLLASAYSHDKWLSAFLGRPPRLSHRYCNIQLPLDLTDRQLLSSGPDLDAAIAALDENGWSRGTRVQRRTWSRAWVQYCKIREDILELSIGVPLSASEVIAKAHSIQEHAAETWQSLPSYLRSDPSDIWDPRRPPIDCLYLVFIQIEYLYNDFLLQRALIKRAGVSTRELLSVAQKILAQVLTVAAKREVLRDFQDTVTMMASPGIPAACVLAVELLRQEQAASDPSSPPAPPPQTPVAGPAPSPILPQRDQEQPAPPFDRSQMIQDLSVFVAALAWVSNEDPSAAICGQGRKFIKTVLDRILGPQQPRLDEAGLAEGGGGAGFDGGGMLMGDLGNLSFFGNDGDFMPWLEGGDWDVQGWGVFG